MVMHRPSPAALMAALLLALAVPAIGVPPADPLDHARALLARADGRAAALILEAALPDADADARPPLLADLRRAYELAALQADAAGQAREVRSYRENLAILNRTPVGDVRHPVPPTRNAPLGATRATDAPRLEAPKPEPQPKPIAGIEPPPALPEPAPSSDAPPAPRAIDQLPPDASSVEAPPPKAPSIVDLIAAADRDFRAGHYDEAGKGYAAAARMAPLPAARRDHWAYCRMVEVVRRINAPPATPAEWALLHAEIERIRALSPKNWFGEYLRNLVAQRAGPGRQASPGATVLRGAAPDEPAAPAPDLRRPAPSVKLASTSAPAVEVAPPAVPAPATGPDEGDWQVRQTPNFRIFHVDPALAERVARVAEATRDQQGRRWVGTGPRPAWSPRCDIYLYPTAAVFAQKTGQPEESPGFSTMGQNSGRIVSRRVNLRADHPNVATAILPHEVTHVVLADLFPLKPIPRWADEGLAVLAEPAAEQRNRARDLADPLKAGRIFRIEHLVSLDCPDGPYWGLYYAQSVSLTRYLVSQGTPAQFVRFLQTAEREGFEAELRRVYQIDGYADLQRRWLAYARSAPDETTATAEADRERR